MRRSDHVRAYILDHLLLTSLTLWAIAAGLAGLVPCALDETFIGITARGHVEWLWAATLLAGGLASGAGLVGSRVVPEVCGLLLIGGSLFIDAYALIDYRGLATGWVSASFMVFLGAGCLARAAAMLAAQRKARREVAGARGG